MKKFALIFLISFSFSLCSFAQNGFDTTKVYELDSISVSAKTNSLNDPAFFLIPADEFKLQNATLGDALKNSSSLFIREYGTGSPQTISYRGLGAENSIVLFNNTFVNDLRTGLFDFSLFNAGEVDLLTFSVADFGSALVAPGGIMNLFSSINEKDKFILSAMYGSNHFNAVKTFFSKKFEQLTLNLSINRSYARNDFSFIFDQKKFQRMNADYSKSSGSIGLNWKNDKTDLRFYSHALKYNNGIPGFVVTNNPASSSARSFSSSLLAVINHSYLFSQTKKIENTISFSGNRLKLFDPTGIVIYQDEAKESIINSLQVQSRFEDEIDNLKYNFGYQFERWNLDGITSFVSAIGSSESMKQNSHRFFSSVNHHFDFVNSTLKKISVYGILSHQLISISENEESNSQTTTFSLGANSKFEIFIPLKVKVNFNSGNRFPSMNERYYSEIFNHYEIKKESYEWYEAGIETDFDRSEKFSVVYFNIKGKDKIFWIPSRLAIQVPRNFASIHSSGFELNAFKQFNFLKSRINLSYTFVDALNKSDLQNDNSFNKNLIYTPNHILSSELKFALYSFQFRINSQFVSERYYTTDNNPSYRLPAYYLTDLHAAYYFEIASTSVGFSVYNLFNEEYSIIQSYPMPLRTFNLSLNMELL